MAFQFPEDKQDFKAPNGITYTYNDGTWMVKSFGSEAKALTYTIQTDKVLRSGEPAIELVDSEGYFSNVKFEADGIIGVYSNPSSIVISSERIEELIDTGFDTQSQILMKNISQDEELQTHTDQINLLETQIQLLAQARAVGKWKYVRNVSNGPRPPADTTFYATNGVDSSFVVRNWSDARLLMIDKTDLNGTAYSFTNFEEGDKVEILDTDGSSACYGTVTNQPNNETYGNLIIAVERSTSGPRDDKEYVISVYRPGAVSGDVDLDILDQRYLRLTGGTLSNSFKIQRGEDKTHPQWKISPNGGTDYATNIYNLEGQMRFRTSHNQSEGDAKGSHIVLDPDVANDGANPTTKIWKLTNPTADDMAANKAYVDSKVPPTSTNNTIGVNYKGQACVTNQSTPPAEQYHQGALIFSTSTNSLYIRT